MTAKKPTDMTQSIMTTQRFDQEAFDAFAQSRQEPGWLTDLRQQAWETFSRIDLPSRRDEEWMRTDIRPLKLDAYAPAVLHPGGETAGGTIAQRPALQPLLQEGLEPAGTTRVWNGQPLGAQLSEQCQRQGVVFGSLPDLLSDHGELIRKHLLQRAVNPHFDKFSALHTAFFSSGTFLYVPRNVVVSEPLFAHSVISGGADLGHVLVVLEEGAEATLLNEMGSPSHDDTGLHCGATELLLGPGSRLRFVNLQDWGHNVWHFAHQQALVDRGATLQWTVGALGSRLSKVNQTVRLTGSDAECQVNGVMFTEGRQHLSYHTLQHHIAPNCRSDFLYKAALQDFSRTVWRGMIKVDPDAQRTDGYQRNDNLLLSHNARADAIPGLEIEADDVRCTHGATTGQVDEELIFYAQTRGMSREEAMRVVVTGFFQQVFDRITIDSVREALGRAIAQRVREYK